MDYFGENSLTNKKNYRDDMIFSCSKLKLLVINK